MCKQETALEMIKTQADMGGLSSAHIKLVESQISDFKTMDKRMAALEEKVEGLDKKIDTLDGKINNITEIVQKRGSLVGTFKELVSNKVILFILLLGLSFGAGIPLADIIGAFVKLGGGN